MLGDVVSVISGGSPLFEENSKLKIAKDLEMDEAGAGLLVEVLSAASLVAVSEDGDPVWCPTTTADRWLAAPLSPERRVHSRFSRAITIGVSPTANPGAPSR